jgi:hypothetical protein
VITTAARVATLPLRRRVIGSLIVLAGVLIVLAGFFIRVYGFDAGTSAGGASTSRLALGTDPMSPSQILRHALDHGIRGDSTIQKAADAGLRGGVVLMAVAAALALVLLMSPVRGLVGMVAGFGIIGAAVTIGIVAGDNTRVSDFTGGSLHVTIGGAGIVCALGFVAIIAGGAVAAVRPLAGLFSGISLAITGAVAGVLVAIAVGGDHIVAAFRGSQGG